jgi:hypothetical protein
MECTICYDELNPTNKLFCTKNSIQMGFCLGCLKYMIGENFSRYIKEISKADCEKSLSGALTHPIPLFVTLNCMKGGVQIEELECQGMLISCKLDKPIDDLMLKKLNEELYIVKLQMLDPSYDYLGEITKIFNSYGV